MIEMETLEIAGNEYEVVDGKARPVNSVAEMKALDNLVAGNVIKTIGYYSANDGGEATYLIREKTENDVEDLGSIHFINDTLVAELIIKDSVNVKQFGAKGDGITDDTNSIQNACITGVKAIIPKSENPYLISNRIKINSSIIFYGQIKMINPNGTAEKSCILVEDYQKEETLFIINPQINGSRDINVSYAQSLGTEYSHAIRIIGSKNIVVSGGILENCLGDGIVISSSENNRFSDNIIVKNVKSTNNFRNACSIISGTNIKILNCKMYCQNGYACLLIEPNHDGTLKAENILIKGGYYYGNKGNVMSLYPRQVIKNVVFKDLTVENDYQSSCAIRSSGGAENMTENLEINNVVILNNNINMQMPITTNKELIIKNLKINNQYKSVYLTSPKIFLDNIETTNENIGVWTIIGENCNIINSDFEGITPTTNDSAILCVNSKNIKVINNKISKSKNLINIGILGTEAEGIEINNAIITDNLFIGIEDVISRSIVVAQYATVNEIYASNNTTKEIDNEFYNKGKVIFALGNSVHKHKIIYSDTIPTGDINYVKGDICINTLPSTSGYIGWVCVTGGAPGVWKEFGAINS